ncbi:hypothetical protein AOCH_001701 [Aspergillus ochraceoroseus]|uniref:Uncharacterized protein n=1 Tax=Aspergillus ochraceoroseus TaxID=138278 RepID=A0A0F8WA23_9EURO|nr:hypothetical protein AOCH_001701 [Aspergillus ochraceoroseus]
MPSPKFAFSKSWKPKDSPWAAKLQGSSLTFENTVGYPFLALTWISGSPLLWSDDFPTRPLRDKVLNQVAVIHASLIECTKATGRVTATDHFTRIINNKFRRAACFPRFLRLQQLLPLPPSFVVQKDRETYTASLRPQTSQEVAWMVRVLSSEDADFDACFLESSTSKGMHQWLARNRWRLPSCGNTSNSE